MRCMGFHIFKILGPESSLKKYLQLWKGLFKAKNSKMCVFTRIALLSNNETVETVVSPRNCEVTQLNSGPSLAETDYRTQTILY